MTAGGISLYLYDKIHVLVNRDHGASHRTSYTRAVDHRAPGRASANATLPPWTMASGSASANERTPLRDGDVSASKKRTPCTTTAVRLVAAVVAVAGCAAGASHLAVPGAFTSSPPLGEHIAMDKRVGPLTSDARNSARMGRFHTTDVPVPPCAKICLADGLDVTIDSSFCFEIDTECVDEECGSLPSADRAAYEAYVADLCVDGVNNDPGHLRYATFDEDLAANGDDDITSDHEPIVTGEPDEDDKFSSASLGRFRAGVDEIAHDAKPSLVTWQCDFDACGAQHPTKNGGVGQYVDDGCDAGGGVGCEGALGGETQCRACYIGPKESIDFDGNLGYPRCPMCVCEQFDKPAEDCILCSGFYKFFKFDVIRARGGWGGNPAATRHNAMQFGELTMFDMHGDVIPVDVASSVNPNGRNPPREGPGGAVDGTLTLKFLDSHFVSNGRSELIFAVSGEPVMIRGYEFFTANDSPSRDPIEWRFSGGQSVDGPWYEFSHISDAAPPASRFASYGVFDPCKSDSVSADEEPTEYRYSFTVSAENVDAHDNMNSAVIEQIELDGEVPSPEQFTIHVAPDKSECYHRLTGPTCHGTTGFTDGDVMTHSNWQPSSARVGTKLFDIKTSKKVHTMKIWYYHPRTAPGWIIQENGVEVLHETQNRGAAFTPTPATYTYTLHP